MHRTVSRTDDETQLQFMVHRPNSLSGEGKTARSNQQPHSRGREIMAPRQRCHTRLCTLLGENRQQAKKGTGERQLALATH